MGSGITQEEYDEILYNIHCNDERGGYEPQQKSSLLINKHGLCEITEFYGAPTTIQYESMIFCMGNISFVGRKII